MRCITQNHDCSFLVEVVWGMKVILAKDMPGLGKKNDVKDVADGHARNFLIPRGMAKPATVEALRALRVFKEQLAKEDTELMKHLRELARQIGERTLEFRVKTDEKGSVFGSVTKEMILKAMRDQGLVRKERAEILLPHPLKTLGGHTVPVDLKKGITATLRITLLPQT